MKTFDVTSFEAGASRPPQATAPKRSWMSMLGWVVVIAVLDLISASGNMSQFARDFFPPDFSEWRTYAHEMIVTLAVAVWGTAFVADVRGAVRVAVGE